MHILEIKDVCLNYYSKAKETPALKDLTFNISEGEFVAIVGPSGCGKTTLLSLISGIIKPTKGKILLKGNEISGTNSNIGYMLQRDHLFEWRTIKKNVMLGLEIQKKINEKSIS